MLPSSIIVSFFPDLSSVPLFHRVNPITAITITHGGARSAWCGDLDDWLVARRVMILISETLQPTVYIAHFQMSLQNAEHKLQREILSIKYWHFPLTDADRGWSLCLWPWRRWGIMSFLYSVLATAGWSGQMQGLKCLKISVWVPLDYFHWDFYNCFFILQLNIRK